jgi:hypothetical protein
LRIASCQASSEVLQGVSSCWRISCSWCHRTTSSLVGSGNLALEGLGLVELEGSLGLKSAESAWMELDRLLLTNTFLEKMGDLGNRRARLGRGGALRSNREGVAIRLSSDS